VLPGHDAQAARRGIERDAQAGRAAADHGDVPALRSAQPDELLFAIHRPVIRFSARN
jgi:hypothetical protein